MQCLFLVVFTVLLLRTLQRPRSEQDDGRRGLLTAAAPEVTLTLHTQELGPRLYHGGGGDVSILAKTGPYVRGRGCVVDVERSQRLLIFSNFSRVACFLSPR